VISISTSKNERDLDACRKQPSEISIAAQSTIRDLLVHDLLDTALAFATIARQHSVDGNGIEHAKALKFAFNCESTIIDVTAQDIMAGPEAQSQCELDGKPSTSASSSKCERTLSQHRDPPSNPTIMAETEGPSKGESDGESSTTACSNQCWGCGPPPNLYRPSWSFREPIPCRSQVAASAHEQYNTFRASYADRKKLF